MKRRPISATENHRRRGITAVCQCFPSHRRLCSSQPNERLTNPFVASYLHLDEYRLLYCILLQAKSLRRWSLVLTPRKYCRLQLRQMKYRRKHFRENSRVSRGEATTPNRQARPTDEKTQIICQESWFPQMMEVESRWPTCVAPNALHPYLTTVPNHLHSCIISQRRL